MGRYDTHEMFERQRGQNPEIRRAVFASGSMCAVTCGECGHVDTLESFIETEIAGTLPRDVFQCPACKRAVRRELGRDKYGDLQCELVPCQAVM